jgi:hypothetical protein
MRSSRCLRGKKIDRGLWSELKGDPLVYYGYRFRA